MRHLDILYEFLFMCAYIYEYLSVKLNGFGTVGCHSFELLGGKLFVSILSSPSLFMLSLLFDSLHVLQLLLAECISLLRIAFVSLSLSLHLKALNK